MKRNKFFLKILIILVSGLFIFSSNFIPVKAQTTGPTLWDHQGTKDKENIGEPFKKTGTEALDVRYYVVDLILVFLTFLALILTVLIIWAGYNWMTSRGEQAVVDKAKEQIKTAIIGFIIILSAYIITRFVVTVYYTEIYDTTFQLGA